MKHLQKRKDRRGEVVRKLFWFLRDKAPKKYGTPLWVYLWGRFGSAFLDRVWGPE